MSDDDFNQMLSEWQEEKDRLLVKLDENNTNTKALYKRIDFILGFTERLPELFKKATADEKKLILTTMANNIYFDGENIQIELKDTFKVLQSLNKFNTKGAKITLRTPNLRTPQKPSARTKKADILPASYKWAGGGDRTHEYRNHNPGP